MSRRRFGDADDTYKDFISAIDDQQHKRKRAKEQQAAMRLAQAQQAQQQQQQQPQSQDVGPPPFDLASGGGVGGGDVGGYQSGAYDPEGLGGLGLRAGGDEDEYNALPVHVMERESWPGLPARRQSSIALGLGGRSPDEAATPLMYEERRKSVAPPPSDHAWISKRNLDLIVQRKSIWIFVNGMFGVGLMVAILQVCWDPLWQARRYGADMSVPDSYYTDLDLVSARLALEPAPLPHGWKWNDIAAQCPSPVRSYVTEVLKFILTISTLVLCWQILDRKRMQVNLKFREQRRKLKSMGYNEARDQLYMSSLSTASNVSTLGLLSLSQASFRWELWLSLMVCLIQPLPFTQQLTHGVVSDKIGLLMWLRLHLAFRVIRDTSEIWLARRSIKHQSTFQIKAPDFDWWLSAKTICYRDPLFFAGCFYFVCILVFAHAIHISERDLLPRYFDFWCSLFVSLQIVSVGWPADIWEIYMPITILGKLVSLLAGMAGLLLISFVIATVGQTLYPTKFEENALNFIAMEKVRQRERDGSARLIQFVWKNAQREAELEAKLAPKNPALYEQLSEQEEKAFMETFLAKSKELRNIRRERAELEERSDPTSERNISPMDQYFDTKLEAIRTDIHHQNAKNQQQFMAIIASLNQLVSKAHKDKQKAAQIQQTTTQHPQSQAAQQAGGGGVGSASKRQQRAAARGAASQQQARNVGGMAGAGSDASAPLPSPSSSTGGGGGAPAPTASPAPSVGSGRGGDEDDLHRDSDALGLDVQRHLGVAAREQAAATVDDAAYRHLADELEQKIYDGSMQSNLQPPAHPLVQPHVSPEEQMPLIAQPIDDRQDEELEGQLPPGERREQHQQQQPRREEQQ